MPNFLPLLIIVIVVLAGLWQFYARQKRRKDLQTWSLAHHFNFDPAKNYSIDQQFSGFDCLQKGDNRHGYNVMTGDWHGHEFMGFDYQYETYSHDSKGRRRTEHHYFSAAVLSSRVALKPLLIRSENLLDRVASFFGYEDINFESSDFSRQFYVSAPEKRWAFDVIQPRVMEFLLASPRFSIQFDQYQLIAYHSSIFSVEEFSAAANVIQGVLERLPDYVVRQQGEEEGKS